MHTPDYIIKSKLPEALSTLQLIRASPGFQIFVANFTQKPLFFSEQDLVLFRLILSNCPLPMDNIVTTLLD